MGVFELPAATCADCVAFSGEEFDDRERILGSCRMRSELGLVPETMPACDSFSVRSSRRGKVQPPKPPPKRGRRRSAPASRVRPTLLRPTVGETEGDIEVDRDGLKQVIREILEEETLYGFPELAARYHQGELVLKPADDNLQPKTIPVETFFHKIVMVRDRLRMLEAKINGNSRLTDADKVQLQQYVSGIYGSLTSFNVLFQDRNDQFRSK